ncbi:MAG: DUF11 domain-containing protein [Saprospiraceae bacterium]|nr:DUF11 domain-containing protein [Saprospiraceae bacterium]
MQKQVQTTLAAGWMLLLLVFSATPSEGQGWYRYYGNVRPYTFSETEILFPTADGGCLQLGNINDTLFAWQVDANGDSVWYKEYTNEWSFYSDFILDQYDWAVQPTGGGAAMLVASGFPINLRLVRLDAWGNMLWQRWLGNPNSTDALRKCSVTLTPDQHFLVSGVLNDSLSVFRLAPDGQLDWTLRFHPGGSGLPEPWKIVPLPGNVFLLQFAAPMATPASGYLAFDHNGQYLPKQPEWDFLAYQFSAMTALADGNFIIFYGLPNDQYVLHKVSPTGQTIFQDTAILGQAPYFLDIKITPTQDDGWVMASKNPANTEYRIVKFDGQGGVAWHSTLLLNDLFDDAEEIYIETIKEAVGGGFLLGGAGRFLIATNSILIKTDERGRVRHSMSAGQIRHDANTDCLAAPTETSLAHWNVQVRDSMSQRTLFHTTQGPDNIFEFDLDTASLYQVQALPPNAYWQNCVADTLIRSSAVGDTLHLDLAAKALVDCPFLETDIGTPFLRRCADNTYQLQYCNTGTTDAEGAYIRVVLDPAMQFVSAGQPATQEAADTWRFEVGAVPVGHCGSFPLTVYLDCNAATLGQNHCVEAHIFPDSVCLTPENWSGAEVDVEGGCHPDSVRFFIKNIGTAPTSQLDYIVIEDNIIYRQGQFQLPPNDSIPVTVPANGSTWYLEAEQEPGSPGNPQPSVTIEGCGQNQQGLFSLGFVSQFGEDDGDPFVSVDCRANIGSFDPNDKLAFPTGYGPEHYIRPGQDLEYLIRFQNTGTDTAFRVVLRDTLSPWLDPGSIVPGAASHPYRFYLSGAGVLNVTFDPIALPDSNVNEPASHGFIKFRVRQRPGLPLGTVINNRAAIYFDFNAAVLTNETWHTLGEDVLTQVRQPEATEDLAVFPNPAPEGATLTLRGRDLPAGRFELFDWTGRQVLSRTVVANQLDLPPGGLPTGVYVFVLWLPNGQLGGRGKLMLKG